MATRAAVKKTKRVKTAKSAAAKSAAEKLPGKRKPPTLKAAKPTVRTGAAAKAKSRKKAPPSAIQRLRELCLAMPETHEVEAWGEPTFRVKGKIFAMHATASTHHGMGREAIWIAAHSATQDLVIRAKPDHYFSPPYVGPSGWIGAWLDRRPLWAEIEDFLKDAYRMKAPKKLAALVGED